MKLLKSPVKVFYNAKYNYSILYTFLLVCVFSIYSSAANARRKVKNNGTTYYVDLAGNDSNDGKSPSTPWKTITKVNSNQLQPGDQVLFKRGGIWNETLVPSASGTSSSPITFGAYGAGNIPYISGLVTLGNWKQINDGVWETDCSSCAVGVNMVTRNGVVQPMGRYPNIDAPNGGYLNIDSHQGNTSITDNRLQGSPDWTGAQVVIRKNHWIIDRSLITSQYGNTINYKSGSHYEAMNNFGYFIQNDPRTLDKVGEWYFNPSTKKMLMFFGPNDPASFVVKVSTRDVLVAIKNINNISFKNLAFEGANENAFIINNATGINILNCNISYSGANAITAAHVNYFNIDGNVIFDTLSSGFTCPTCSNTNITNNTIKNTGMIPGMGKDGEGTYCAISICVVNNTSAVIKFGSNNLVANNHISYTGYLPVNFNGDSIVVKNNVIDHFAINKDDAGGIYVWTGPNNPQYTGRKIIGNIISYGMEARDGTDPVRYVSNSTMPWTANGIYIDDNVTNVEIRDNTIFNNNGGGIYLHNASRIVIDNNTIYNNHIQLFFAHSNNFPNSLVKDNVISNNIIFARDKTQAVGDFRTMRSDELNQMAKFDNNKYNSGQSGRSISMTISPDSRPVAPQTMSIRAWSAQHNNDLEDQTASKGPVRFEYNDSSADKTIQLDGTYTDLNKNVYSNTLTLKPFKSVILKRQ